MKEWEFKELIEGYGLNPEDAYNDLSVLGLVLYIDLRQDFSIAIECHKSSSSPVVLFNKRDRGKVITFSKPLNDFTKDVVQSLKNGSAQFTKQRKTFKKVFSVKVFDNNNELFCTVSRSGT